MKTARNKTIQSVAIAPAVAGGFKKTVLPVTMKKNTKTLTLNLVIFDAGDILRVDDELLYVTAVNGTTVTIDRAQGGTKTAEHLKNAVIYALSEVMKKNLPVNASGDNPVKYMETVLKQLHSALGSYQNQVTFVPMPVLFDFVIFNGSNIATGYLAMTSNVVNCLATGTSVFYSKTGCSTFESYVNNELPGATPIDIWDDYHCQQGEIHCATAVKRSLSAQPPWWETIKNWK